MRWRNVLVINAQFRLVMKHTTDVIRIVSMIYAVDAQLVLKATFQVRQIQDQVTIYQVGKCCVTIAEKRSSHNEVTGAATRHVTTMCVTTVLAVNEDSPV